LGCFGATSFIRFGNRDYINNTDAVSTGSASFGDDLQFGGNVWVSGPCPPDPNRGHFYNGGSYTCPSGTSTATICSFSVTAGSQDVNVANQGTATLAPGNYKNVVIGSGANVTLSPGVYNVNSFTTGTDVTLTESGSGLVEINSAGQIKIGDRTNFVGFGSGIELNSAYTSAPGLSDAAILIGSDLNQRNGYALAPLYLDAPNGLIYFNSRARVSGSAVADRIFMADDVVFKCNPLSS